MNLRDLGGLPTTNGRWTRWRSVLRSDSLAGVPLDVIAADYAIGATRLHPLSERLMSGAPDDTARRRLQRENVSAASTITGALTTHDVREYLRTGGATAADPDLVVERLVEDLRRQTRGGIRSRAS